MTPICRGLINISRLDTEISLLSGICMNTRFLSVALALVVVGCSVSPTGRGHEVRITDEDYAAAEKLISHHLGDKVRNEKPEAHWLGPEDKFWYERDGDSGSEFVLVDAGNGERQFNFKPELPETPRQPEPGTLRSPDGKWSAFAREHNLWVTNTESGEERQLTDDGAPYYSYGGAPEQYRLDAMRAGLEFPQTLANSYWSPDSRYLVVARLDERKVSEYHFLESVPQNGSVRARAHSLRVPLLGDSGQRVTNTFVFDVEYGEKRAIELPSTLSLSFFAAGNRPIAWGPDSEVAYFLGASEGDKAVHLLKVEMISGNVRSVLEERAETSVTLGHNLGADPNVRILNDTKEVIWFSERDGWGHLYLFDLSSGRLKNRITSGDWTVWDITHIDENQRLVYFTAGGREPGSDPYYRKLYRAPLDGTGIRLLTPEEAHHEIQDDFSPSGNYFVETYSTVDTAPRFLLRSANEGNIIAELETADASELYATGWRAPERFSAKSADGSTDIWGAVYFPPDFDPLRAYPVIDAIYGGPVSVVAPRTLRQAYASGYQRASLARLGFIVVSLDGRGTPFRSRAFREAGYGNFADPQLEDHVAAIQQIAERIPSMDLERVGIYGHSNGGYMAARAMLKYPEIFKVGVSSAGPHNFHGLPGTGMPWMGIPRYEGGASLRPEDGAVPDNYRVLDNAELASGLRGDLLLICGDMDNTAFPALTLQLADALTKTNKSFDMLYLPNRNHRYFVDEPYVMRRIWDYFVEHLHGVEPPVDYEMREYGAPVFQ
jgi:dipeptidyl aminopeptidase/acylaminoacyl peptidase